MTQRDRDRLVALKKAKKKLITQRQAAEEIGVAERLRNESHNCAARYLRFRRTRLHVQIAPAIVIRECLLSLL